MSTSPTCTVVTAVGGRCGKPAVYSWTTSRGATYFECAAHVTPGVVGTVHGAVVAPPAHPPTRTTKPFVLVAGGKIVGYADSSGPAVQKRAARLGAAIVPVSAMNETCPTCGGEGYVGGLVISDDLDVPTVDERCYRCKGTGVITVVCSFCGDPAGAHGAPHACS